RAASVGARLHESRRASRRRRHRPRTGAHRRRDRAQRDARTDRMRGTGMCLGVPGKIIDINGSMATVDFWGVRRQVNLDIVDEPVQPGDYILNHVGFAIRRIPEESIAETLSLYEILMKEAEEDAMAADVRG